MRKKIYSGLMIAAMLVLAGCSGGSSKGQTAENVAFSELHGSYLPEISLSGDFTLTYECKVENESGTLEGSELDFDLVYDDTTLHMPLFDADTYLEYTDGTVYEFSAEDKARSRKEPGSVYSSNKVPSNGVGLTINLSRSGDVLSGEATYEGGAMGKGNHRFWIYHFYSGVKLPEEMVLKVAGQELKVTEISYVVE